MCASGWFITLLLLRLLDSATSSPISKHTSAPPLSVQIAPPSPFPTIIPPPQSPSLSAPPPAPPSGGSPAATAGKVRCPLTLSPSALVVRFGDPVTVNCSATTSSFEVLGWEVSLAAPEPTHGQFLVWNVDNMTEWNIKPLCYALIASYSNEVCLQYLSLIVYKPPDSVSISFANHTGPMCEGRQYLLQCTVQEVAPVENLTVTFYKGQVELDTIQSNYTAKTPVTETFTLVVNPTKDDDGVQYWCEAKLDLGAEGPQRPQVVTSQKLTAVVQFGPQLLCPTKVQVQEGERVSCEVRGNPKPVVTWFKDGLVVSLPTHSDRQHAGKYTILADGFTGQKNLTVEVEVLTGSGTAGCCSQHFLLAVLLIQILTYCLGS